jgi:hypothetical protein
VKNRPPCFPDRSLKQYHSSYLSSSACNHGRCLAMSASQWLVSVAKRCSGDDSGRGRRKRSHLPCSIPSQSARSEKPRGSVFMSPRRQSPALWDDVAAIKLNPTQRRMP